MLHLYVFGAGSLQEHLLLDRPGAAFRTIVQDGPVLAFFLEEGRWRMRRPEGFRMSPDFEGETLTIKADKRYELEKNGTRHAVYARTLHECDMCFDLWRLPARGAVGIGRSRSNQIVYRDQLTSAHHGLLQRDARGLLNYRDMSTNGSYVNGVALHNESRKLVLGDVLQIPAGLKLIVLEDGIAINQPAERYGVALLPMGYPETDRSVMDIFVPGLSATYSVDVQSGVSFERTLEEIAERIDQAEDATLMRGGMYHLIPLGNHGVQPRCGIGGHKTHQNRVHLLLLRRSMEPTGARGEEG